MMIYEKGNTVTHLIGTAFALSSIWMAWPAVHRGWEMAFGVFVFRRRNVFDVSVEFALSLGEAWKGQGYSTSLRPYQHICDDCLFVHASLRGGDRGLDRLADVCLAMGSGDRWHYLQDCCFWQVSAALIGHILNNGLECSIDSSADYPEVDCSDACTAAHRGYHV